MSCNVLVTAIKTAVESQEGMWKVQTVLGYCTEAAAKDVSDFG
jgi:hypothetical protein